MISLLKGIGERLNIKNIKPNDTVARETTRHSIEQGTWIGTPLRSSICPLVSPIHSHRAEHSKMVKCNSNGEGIFEMSHGAPKLCHSGTSCFECSSAYLCEDLAQGLKLLTLSKPISLVANLKLVYHSSSEGC